MKLREIKDAETCLHCKHWKEWIGVIVAKRYYNSDVPLVRCSLECEGYGQQTLVK